MKKKAIAELLSAEGIDLFSFLSLSECRITKKYLLDRIGIAEGSVIVMAVPYACDDIGGGNISEYAKSRDYHLFFSQLFSGLTTALKSKFPENNFFGFADHSPIDERHAAALAGLGVIGKNRLLLTEKYSSFVFLGEVITDLPLDSEAGEIGYCHGCDACQAACPVSFEGVSDCLSAVTQKKGELDPNQSSLIRSSGCAWGCDACQLACPYTRRAIERGTIFTPIPFFTEDRIDTLSLSRLAHMSDGEFAERAYSWRGRETVARNLSLLESDPTKDTLKP
jgi:epoxyqueuosine reductase